MRLDLFFVANIDLWPQQNWLTLIVLFLMSLTFSNQLQTHASLRFEKQMKQLKTRHAIVLAAWAVLNLIFGGILMVITTDEQLSFFHAMNGSWGLVNLGVAWFLYAHHNEVFEQPQTLLQQMDHQRHIEKMVLFSIGLDLAFI
jgi:hypothetical protein